MKSTVEVLNVPATEKAFINLQQLQAFIQVNIDYQVLKVENIDGKDFPVIIYSPKTKKLYWFRWFESLMDYEDENWKNEHKLLKVDEEKVRNLLTDEYVAQNQLYLMTQENIYWVVELWLYKGNAMPIDYFLDLFDFDNLDEDVKQTILVQLGSIFYSSLLYAGFEKEKTEDIPHSERIEEFMEKIDSLLDELDAIDSDIEKAKYLTNYIYKNCEYDRKFLIWDQKRFKAQAEKRPTTMNVFNPILEWKGVCQSYSALFSLIWLIIGKIASVEYWKNEPFVNHFNCMLNIDWNYYLADPTSWHFSKMTKKAYENKGSITI